MAITNDIEFKTALNGLAGSRQRMVAARFAENVLALSQDNRVKSVVKAAKGGINDDEIASVRNSAKAASVDSFTQCGKECDWASQAGHFVAEAALACVKADEAGVNPAWDAAMHARMARTCDSIATGKGTDNTETAVQYRILAEFMNG